MDDKLVRLQIARTGTFGADGRTIVLQDLQDVIDTFDGRAPISLGHYAARQDWMPSWGNVENLMLESTGEGEATLVADITIRDVLWDAIKTGFYPGWSVSIPTKPDGKHYLHHLAFLGAMPPAIRDLKILDTADGDVPEDAIKVQREDISPEVTALYSYADFGEDGRPEEVIQDKDDEGAETPAGEKEPESEEDDEKEEKPEEAAPPAQEEKKDFSDSASKVVEKARKVFSSSIKASLDAAMEGKVSAALKAKVHEFADEALSSWDFADAAEEPKIITLFKEILEGIGKRPKPGRMDFSDHKEEKPVNLTDLARKF